MYFVLYTHLAIFREISPTHLAISAVGPSMEQPLAAGPADASTWLVGMKDALDDWPLGVGLGAQAARAAGEGRSGEIKHTFRYFTYAQLTLRPDFSSAASAHSRSDPCASSGHP